ncbi:ATP-dependent helicase HrpB [Humisphaera borealis]|uniref:ATP-dependent helicase HrpB n=1 Tax=Humisphaera borealis TaxID=2807512 RepID=A0A7M2WXA8_9BACT|nr:ATP-dependent helicase HrpB [Humisphaera borealis]QOV90033.1 ATP-dependent helicase HrpB [Humisphaera borealis]
MIPLPIDRYLPDVVAAAKQHRAMVLVAPPGAGKTTRVPPAILAAGLMDREHPNLVMLQPRRVAARASAARIADEQGWTLGGRVGYQVRFEKRIGPDTRLKVFTEGILTRQLLDDPFLEGVGCVILDEFHERSIHTDLCAALLREVKQTVRDDLILIVMSATLEAEPVSRFLGGCPIVRTEGRTFPVEVKHTGYSQAYAWERAADAVMDVVASAKAEPTEPGDILVFLPGVDEIRRCGERLSRFADERNLLVLPLHGSLPPDEQTLALRPSKQRKVILSTNIAETSLTIDGVRTVIDSGLARIAGYDAQRGMDKLELERISLASATQRAGRAGRTAPGVCIRLWSKSEEQAMAAFTTPEIRRVDLCGTALLLHAWGKPDLRNFGWYEPPAEDMLVSAERLLAMIGALDADVDGKITPLGQRIMALPTHPRLARLLIGAAEAGLLEQGAAVAALLAEKDIAWEERGTPRWMRETKTIGPSDLLLRLDLLEQAEKSRFAPHLRDSGIDPVAARQAAKARDDLLRIAERLDRDPRSNTPVSNAASGAAMPKWSALDHDEIIIRLALLAYPDRVCRRRASDPAAAAMVGGTGVRLAAESVVRQHEFFLALDARQDARSQTREAMVKIASGINVEWLEEFFSQSIRRERVLVYDEQRKRVVARGTTSYRDLLLKEDKDAPVDPAAAGPVLAEALRPRARELFEADEKAVAIMDRLNLLRKHMPEQAWPSIDDAGLGDILAEACAGRRSLDEIVGRTSLGAILESQLQYPFDRLLDQHAPESIEVPTGNRIALQYRKAEPPILAVRLQEVFGWFDTPRIAGGRVPVLMHLLGPNYRPVQVTDDLRSFWTTTYFQVRKDLRVRYPKHSWPEDPLTATPVARGGRRRT